MVTNLITSLIDQEYLEDPLQDHFYFQCSLTTHHFKFKVITFTHKQNYVPSELNREMLRVSFTKQINVLFAEAKNSREFTDIDFMNVFTLFV